MESLISVLYFLQYNEERKKSRYTVYSGYYGNTNGTTTLKWNTLPIKNKTWYN